MIKPLKLGTGLSSKIPFEINVAGIISIPVAVWGIGQLAYSWYYGYNFCTEVRDYLSIEQINGLTF